MRLHPVELVTVEPQRIEDLEHMIEEISALLQSGDLREWRGRCLGGGMEVKNDVGSSELLQGGGPHPLLQEIGRLEQARQVLTSAIGGNPEVKLSDANLLVRTDAAQTAAELKGKIITLPVGATPIDYQREDFTRVLPGEFDVVFDGIGKDGYGRSLAALRRLKV